MSNKTGIFGGTFNPVHKGHIEVAGLALDRIGLNKIYFVPSYNPPHKNKHHIVSYDHRLKMLSLALQNDSRFDFSLLDYTPGEKSYTKNLIIRFREKYPQDSLFLIIGTDNIPQLKTWHDYKWILDNIKIIAIQRNYEDTGDPVDYHDRIQKIVIDPVDISSKGIRQRIKEGKSIAGLVPDPVIEYIKKYNLYEND